MAKKKGGRTRNPGLIGGKNTLPKNSNGGVDYQKVVKHGAQEQRKKWVDKKVVKGPGKTKSQARTKPLVKPTRKPRFKPVTLAKRSAKPNVQLPAHKRMARPITAKRAQSLYKNRLTVARPPVKKSPNPTKNPSVDISKLRSVALKNQPAKKLQTSPNVNANRLRGLQRMNTLSIKSKSIPKPQQKSRKPAKVIKMGR
ncbi:MAG: hypothetical protein R2824_15990 [Saprospiraceae bacterium]